MKVSDLPIVVGESSPWGRLNIHAKLANTTQDIDRNIESCISRNLPSFANRLVGTKRGAVSVVGSGPSLKEKWKELARLQKNGVPIIACNAAFQFLLERGVQAEYFFCFDADPLMLEFMTPKEGTTYLLASRCPPKAFDLIEGQDIYVWHTMGDENIIEILKKHDGPDKQEEFVINGGSAAVVRAMVMAQTMGYSKLHIWGGDSSFKNGDTHIRKSTTEERTMFVMVNKRSFEIAPWMAVQVKDFTLLAASLQAHQGVKIIVHGDSLLSHVAMTMGIETDHEPRYKQIARNVKMKGQLFWNAL